MSVGRSCPRSASRPASGATSAPASPASPNSPMTPSPYSYGGLASRNASDVHSTAKPPKASAPKVMRWRRTGSDATSDSTERSASGWPSRSAGARGGRPRRSASASASIATAARANTRRQPPISATSPLRVRESRIPTSRPLMTCRRSGPGAAGRRASPRAAGGSSRRRTSRRRRRARPRGPRSRVRPRTPLPTRRRPRAAP